jgi:hypothetical protein
VLYRRALANNEGSYPVWVYEKGDLFALFLRPIYECSTVEHHADTRTFWAMHNRCALAKDELIRA